MATTIHRAMYANIGGGSRLLSSLYINSGGSRKTISSAFANISGTRKQIFPYSATTTTTYYYWKRYEVKTTGSTTRVDTGKSYVEIGSYNYYAIHNAGIGQDGSGMYMDFNSYVELHTGGISASNSYQIFTISSYVPSSGRIYAKDTFDGNFYMCQHNTYLFTPQDTSTLSVGCRYSDNCMKRITYSISSYSQGSYIDEVSSTSRYAYPDNNYSGSYWYIYDRSQVVYS